MAKIIKIDNLFDGPSRRILSDAQLKPNSSLIAQGWERRFTADEQRAKEAMELYSQLGYEVRAEPVLPAKIARPSSLFTSRRFIRAREQINGPSLYFPAK
jgi:hypothetical protein